MFTPLHELEAGIESVKASPVDNGVVKKIVCRPETGGRKELDDAQLDTKVGLIGDNWLSRGYKKTPEGLAHAEMQLNLMNSRAIALIARCEDRWALAGDQFFVDLDLSTKNLPPGTQLQIGEATIEVTAEPHLGCLKFRERFGRDAALFVNTDLGRSLNLRGINAKVINPGRARTGSMIRKLQDQRSAI